MSVWISESFHSPEVWLPSLLAMLVLMTVSAFLSASETALFFLSPDEIRAFRVGRTRERAAALLLSDPDRVLNGILFWNLVVNLLFFAVSVVSSERLLIEGHRAAAGIFGVLALLALLFFGEVLPKVVAALFRKSLAPLVAWPIAVIVGLLDPILPLFRGLTAIARRTVMPNVRQEAYLNAEDLENAVNVSDLRAETIRQEKQILHNILDLSEVRVEEVMRPRGTYPALRPPVRIADFGSKIPAGDYVAIVRKGSDDIEGIIPLASFTLVPTDRLDDAAEDVVHVPWCATLASVLSLLREQVASVAAVLNEYGETIGIVTYDDIMDAALVPEPDRAVRFLAREPVLEVAPGCFHVEGITSLRHLCSRLGIEYDPDSDELVTVTGLLHEKLEHIPTVGDECSWRGYRVRVIEVSKRGRLRAMVTKEPRPAEAPP